MEKGRTVFYRTSQGHIIKATVTLPHRGTTVTLTATFRVDPSGKSIGPYIGQRVKLPRKSIFTNPRAAGGLPGTEETT